MTNKRRWIPFLVATISASGCGILLGMLLLSVFTSQEIGVYSNGLNNQELPKVVQASTISSMTEQVDGIIQDSTLAGNNELSNRGQPIATNSKDKLLIEKQIFFPIMNWNFIQVGVFNEPSYAQPIINQLNKHKINPQMIDQTPSRVMAAGFIGMNKANTVSKHLSVVGVELYTRDLHLMYNPITLELPEDKAVLYDTLFNNQLLDYLDQLQETSYEWITGSGNYSTTLTLLDKLEELKSTIKQIDSYGGNNENAFLSFLTAELTKFEQLISEYSNNRQVGWIIQEHTLILLSKCKVL